MARLSVTAVPIASQSCKIEAPHLDDFHSELICTAAMGLLPASSSLTALARPRKFSTDRSINRNGAQT